MPEIPKISVPDRGPVASRVPICLNPYKYGCGAGVSEEVERADSAPEGPAGGVDPVAVALALGGASQAQADAFLKKQEAFIDDQRHHLREQFKQLCLGTWEKRLGVFLRIATLFIGLAVAGGAGWFIWNAASSNDLVIDAFQVPPDLASHGLSGP